MRGSTHKSTKKTNIEKKMKNLINFRHRQKHKSSINCVEERVTREKRQIRDIFFDVPSSAINKIVRVRIILVKITANPKAAR